jgi:hypothetical protein
MMRFKRCTAGASSSSNVLAIAMNEGTASGDGPHPQALLLPWFLAEALSEFEHEAISAHLSSCNRCRQELEGLSALRRAVRSELSNEPRPSPETLRRVLEQIDGLERSPRAAKQRRHLPHNRLMRLWRPAMPALAAATIALQCLVILELVHAPATTAPMIIASRGLASPGSRFSLLLTPAAPAQAVRTMLATWSARIIDGPTEDGVYTIEVPAMNQRRLGEILQRLRDRPELVERAEILGP